MGPLWDLPTLAGAGALRSNVGDMLTFLAANIGPPQSRLEQSMRDSHEARRNANAQTNIGLNWHVLNVGEADIILHDGGTAGFTTFIGFDPDRQVGVVLLANMGQAVVADIGLHLLDPNIPLSEPTGGGMGGWSVTLLLVSSAVGMSILLVPVWRQLRNRHAFS